MSQSMSKVWIVQGEHPYDPYYPLELYASEDAAEKRCAELTADFIKDVWEIEHSDTPLLPAPEVTLENWEDLVEEHGDDGDEDGFGRWSVWKHQEEIRGEA